MNDASDRPFSEHELYGYYKKVRNRLRTYEPESLLALIVEALHQAAHGGVEVFKKYQPWNILLLAKWTLQEADSVAHRRPHAILNDLHHLLNGVSELYEHVRMPNDYAQVALFLRHLAFQQFWLQRPVDGAAIARQEILFCRLDRGHQFQREFLRLAGVSCTDFSELGLGLTLLFGGEPKRRAVQHDTFSTLHPEFQSRSVDPFLRALSRDLRELVNAVSTPDEKSRTIMDQILLPTPLVNFPLWRRGKDYAAFSPTLLFRSVEKFIFRALKKEDPINFSAKFGEVFQSYIGQCVKDAQLMAIDESALAQMLDGTGKCVDFLIRDTDCDVLIEAKGVETSDVGRVSHRAEIVFQSLKQSGIKAIRQGMDTARRLRVREKQSGVISKNDTYLLVVTFDALHLGSNTGFEGIFGKAFFEKLKIEFGDPLPVPTQNIFFMAVEEFEGLLAMIGQKRTTWRQVMERAQQNDSQRQTHKFSFGQHLDSMGIQTKRLTQLQTALDELCERCKQRLTK